MKKLTTVLFALLCANSLFSQQWDGNNDTSGNISRVGNVSVGTADSYDKLTVFENLRMVNGKINFGYHLPNRGSYLDTFFAIEHIPFAGLAGGDGLYILLPESEWEPMQ